MLTDRQAVIAELRESVDKIEGAKLRPRLVLPFGVPSIDSALPGGGLAYGAVHEIAGGGADAVVGACSAMFIAGIAARTKGSVVWCLTRADIYAPALAQVGLHPDRVIYVESADEAGVMASVEEALRYGGLGAVVGEIVRLSMTDSRRFQLAAEQSGTIGLLMRRWRRPTEATDFGNPTASRTRWRVSSMPSAPLPVEGIGRARWMLELMRSRGGDGAEWIVDACDVKGDIQLSAARDNGTDRQVRYR